MYNVILAFADSPAVPYLKFVRILASRYRIIPDKIVILYEAVIDDYETKLNNDFSRDPEDLNFRDDYWGKFLFINLNGKPRNFSLLDEIMGQISLQKGNIVFHFEKVTSFQGKPYNYYRFITTLKANKYFFIYYETLGCEDIIPYKEDGRIKFIHKNNPDYAKYTGMNSVWLTYCQPVYWNLNTKLLKEYTALFRKAKESLMHPPEETVFDKKKLSNLKNEIVAITEVLRDFDTLTAEGLKFKALLSMLDDFMLRDLHGLIHGDNRNPIILIIAEDLQEAEDFIDYFFTELPDKKRRLLEKRTLPDTENNLPERESDKFLLRIYDCSGNKTVGSQIKSIFGFDFRESNLSRNNADESLINQHPEWPLILKNFEELQAEAAENVSLLLKEKHLFKYNNIYVDYNIKSLVLLITCNEEKLKGWYSQGVADYTVKFNKISDNMIKPLLINLIAFEIKNQKKKIEFIDKLLWEDLIYKGKKYRSYGWFASVVKRLVSVTSSDSHMLEFNRYILSTPPPPISEPKKEQVITKSNLMDALEYCKNIKSKVARELHISRPTLDKYLKKYKINL
ncbi:MAG: helix-turn-helix domain-containing protein [archaeon]